MPKALALAGATRWVGSTMNKMGKTLAMLRAVGGGVPGLELDTLCLRW